MIDNPAFGTYVRWVLLIGMIINFVIFFVSTVVSWKHLSIGQRFFLVGVLGMQDYICFALHKAISLGLPFEGRLVALTIGEICFACYLAEPKHITKARRGGGIFERGPQPPLQDDRKIRRRWLPW